MTVIEDSLARETLESRANSTLEVAKLILPSFQTC